MLDSLTTTHPAEVSLAAADDRAWSTIGELQPPHAVRDLYISYLTLDDEVGDLDEVVSALRARLAVFHLTVSEDDRGRSVLILTLESADLWLAVLQTMNAVRAIGHEAVAVWTVPAREVA